MKIFALRLLIAAGGALALQSAPMDARADELVWLLMIFNPTTHHEAVVGAYSTEAICVQVGKAFAGDAKGKLGCIPEIINERLSTLHDQMIRQAEAPVTPIGR